MAHTPLFRALLRALQQARRANLTSTGRPAPTLLFLLPTADGEAVEVLGSSDELNTVVGGTSRLIDALGAALGKQIKLRHALTRVEQRGQSYTLSFEAGPTCRPTM